VTDTPELPTGFVYVIGTLEGCHKIGRSNCPSRRSAEIGLLLPVPLSVVHKIATRDEAWLESYLHHAFGHRRVRGEWFRLTAEDLTLLNSLSAASVVNDIPESVRLMHLPTPGRGPDRLPELLA
jgi:hypothetical protein